MFGIFKTIMDVKKGVRDPGGLGKELALDIIKVPLLLFTILGGLFSSCSLSLTYYFSSSPGRYIRNLRSWLIEPRIKLMRKSLMGK